METIISIALNVLSSIIYDIGKKYIQNAKRPLSEKQIFETIQSFQSQISDVSNELEKLDCELNSVMEQNETIFKLLLMIFDQSSNLRISYTPNGYLICGDYTLNNFADIVQERFKCYTQSLPTVSPKNLGKATWPIPQKLKGVLLDEIENDLFN